MTSDQVGVTIGVAARMLGISENAVRKRIRRGSLEASKDQSGQWWVIVSDQAAGVAGGGSRDQDATRSEPIDAQYRTADDDDDPGVALMRVTDAFDRLEGLIHRNEELALELGTLRERTEHLETENKRLQQRIAEFEATQSPESGVSASQDESPDTAEDKPQEGARRPWWRFWES